MKSLIPSLFFFFIVATPVWAGSFSLNFNDMSTQVAYVQKLNTQNYGDTHAKIRYLYNDDSKTNLFGVAGGVVGAPGNIAGLKFGVDVALNGGETANDKTFLAVGLGLLADYAVPVLPGLGIDGHIVYSPKIFNFVDSEDYFEWGFGTSYQVLPNAKVTLAYQNIQVDIENAGNYDLDETLRFGVEFSF